MAHVPAVVCLLVFAVFCLPSLGSARVTSHRRQLSQLSDDGGDGDIPVSLGGDGIISGPAFNANGDPIPTPQTLGGLSAHQYPPAVSARNAGHAKPRNAIPPPLKRGGSAKGLLKAQTELASGGAVKLCTESGSLRRQLPARALLADPAAGVGALEDTPGAGLMTVLTETEGNEPGADEADETAGEADAAADAEAAADSGAVEADGGAAAIDAAEQTPVALPVVEEQPISVQEQGSPDNQPEGVAAGALPDVDGNPADELGPAAAAAALNGPLPEAQAQRQAAGAGTAAAASGAGPNDEAVGRPGADAAAVDAGASAEAAAAADVTAEPDAGSEIQSAMGAAAAGNTVAAVGGAADAVRAASQEKAVQDTARFRPLPSATAGEADQPSSIEGATWDFYNAVPSAFAGASSIYLPVLWSNLLLGPEGRWRAALQEYLDGLDKTQRYWTVLEVPQGLDCPRLRITVPQGLYLLIFAAGGVTTNAKNVPIPLLRREVTAPPPDKVRDHKVSFIGPVQGAERQALFSNFEEKFYWYKGGKLWKDHLKRSVYTICYATQGPATYRLAEAIQAETIPIYVWDHVQMLPYLDELDWTQFAVVLHRSDVSKLSEIDGLDATAMRAKLREFRHMFTFDFVVTYIAEHVSADKHGPLVTMVDVLPSAAPLDTVVTSDQTPSAEQPDNAAISSVPQETAAQQQPADLPQAGAETASEEPAGGSAPITTSAASVSAGATAGVPKWRRAYDAAAKTTAATKAGSASAARPEGVADASVTGGGMAQGSAAEINSGAPHEADSAAAASASEPRAPVLPSDESAATASEMQPISAEPMESLASAGGATAATEGDAQQTDAPIADASAGDAEAGIPLRLASTQLSNQPDAGAAGTSSDLLQAAEQLEAMAAAAAEGFTGEQPELDSEAGATAAIEPSKGLQMADDATSTDSAAQGAAAAGEQLDSATGAGSGSGEATNTNNPASEAAVEEVAAAVQAAAQGISKAVGASEAAAEGQAELAEVEVQPAAVDGNPGGVSDEDLAAEAAEARKRHQLQR